MTSEERNKLNAKAEVILMGLMQPVDTKEEIIYLLDYILRVINCTATTGEQLYTDALQYSKNSHITYIHIGRYNLCGDEMTMITLPIAGNKVKDTEKYLLSKDGTLAYVFNATAPDCSELGYTYFDRKLGKLTRIA